jgi:hypothetical protein
VNDLKPHSAGGWCKCSPQVDVQPNGNKVVVHNAWDGREFYESETSQRGYGRGIQDAEAQ